MTTSCILKIQLENTQLLIDVMDTECLIKLLGKHFGSKTSEGSEDERRLDEKSANSVNKSLLLPDLTPYARHPEKVGQKIFEILGGNEVRSKLADLTKLPQAIKEIKEQGFGIDEKSLYEMDEAIKKGKKIDAMTMADIFAASISPAPTKP